MNGWFDMDLSNLTPEQIEKAKDFKSADELIAFAKSEGVELTDEQLEKISVGDVWEESHFTEYRCPSCGKLVTWVGTSDRPVLCPYCGVKFNW